MCGGLTKPHTSVHSPGTAPGPQSGKLNYSNVAGRTSKVTSQPRRNKTKKKHPLPQGARHHKSPHPIFDGRLRTAPCHTIQHAARQTPAILSGIRGFASPSALKAAEDTGSMHRSFHHLAQIVDDSFLSKPRAWLHQHFFDPGCAPLVKQRHPRCVVVVVVHKSSKTFSHAGQF